MTQYISITYIIESIFQSRSFDCSSPCRIQCANIKPWASTISYIIQSIFRELETLFSIPLTTWSTVPNAAYWQYLIFRVGKLNQLNQLKTILVPRMSTSWTPTPQPPPARLIMNRSRWTATASDPLPGCFSFVIHLISLQFQSSLLFLFTYSGFFTVCT